MPFENNVPCIYCQKLVDPTKGEGDHIIPAALGEFEGDSAFRRICPSCNSSIGKFEEQLLRCGPESLLRRLVNTESRRTRKRKSGMTKGALGMKPPLYRAKVGDHWELVRPSPEETTNGMAVDQVVVCDADGKEAYIRLFPGMHGDQVKERARKEGVAEIKQIRLSCDEQRADEYFGLIRQTWPMISLAETGSVDAGTHRVPGRVKFQFSVPYFQALAKIGFHYYLVYSSRGLRGDEACFAAIRDFITKGGDVEQFVSWDQEVVATPFGETTEGLIGNENWCHIVSATERDGHAIAQVQLFVGPKHLPHPYCIMLGKLETAIVLPKPAWAHVYTYEDREDRFAGTATQANVTR